MSDPFNSDPFNISLAPTNKVNPPGEDPTGLWPGENYKVMYKIDTVHNETEAVDITFPLLHVPANMSDVSLTQFGYLNKESTDAEWKLAQPETNDGTVPFSIKSTNPLTVHDYHNDLDSYKFVLLMIYSKNNHSNTAIIDPEIHNKERG
jgi:hypothetical protein